MRSGVCVVYGLTGSQLPGFKLRREACAGKCDWMQYAEAIDVNCTFSLRLGLWSEPGVQNHSGPALRLTMGDSYVVTPQSQTRLARPALCFLHDRPRDNVPVVLVVANDFEYLFRTWAYFAHKATWAMSSKLPFVLWVGSLPARLRRTSGPLCQKYTSTHETRRQFPDYESYYAQNDAINSNHYSKILALLALVEQPDVPAVLYTDLDAIVADKFYDQTNALERYLQPHYDDKADVVFSDSFRVRSNHFYVRNSTLARDLLTTWMKFRCGFDDQHSLWHVVLMLADRHGCLLYNDELFSANFSYDDAVYWAADDFKRRFPAFARDCDSRCPDFRVVSSCDGPKADIFRHHAVPSGRLVRLEYKDAHGGIAALDLQDDWAVFENRNKTVPQLMAKLRINTFAQDIFL